MSLRIANRYAKGLLSFTQEQKNSDAMVADMNALLSLSKDSKDFVKFLKSPVISMQQKQNAAKEIFKSFNPTTQEFVNLLILQKRENLLGYTASEYIKLYDEVRGVTKAVVVTAKPLDAKLEAQVLGKAESISGKAVELMNEVDPTIIGGFVLKIGDKLYDASIANQLKSIKRKFSQN